MIKDRQTVSKNTSDINILLISFKIKKITISLSVSALLLSFSYSNIMMAVANEFKIVKMELLNCYEEYAAMLRSMELTDVNNISKLSKLSEAHSRLADCQKRYTLFVSDYFQSIRD